MELSIDTSTTCAAVGLSDQGEFVAEYRWRSPQNHCVELAPAIRDLMRRAGVGMARLEAVFVARGPGGFSALRVGMSAAKALSAALDIPLVSVNTLDVEAAPYLPLGSPVAAVIPAGRNRLYLGGYAATPDGEPPSYRVIQSDELARLLSPGDVVCGEAAAECAAAAESAGARGSGSVASHTRSRRAGEAGLRAPGTRLQRRPRGAATVVFTQRAGGNGPTYLGRGRIAARHHAWG